MSASYIADSEGNIVYPKTLAKCVNKGGSTLEEYLNDVEDATLIKPTVSGTDMVINDSSNMNIQELHLFGKTDQKTTKGINLLKTEQQNETRDGITITRNDDGTFTLNGTATKSVDYTLTKKFLAEKGKTYRMTGINNGSGISMYVTDGSASYSCATRVGVTFTYTSESSDKYIHLQIPSGKPLDNIIVKPMIVDGLTYPNTTYDDYEPYTGGQPSPNPEYQQEMVGVENPVIKIAGKNLFDCSNKEFSTKCYINENATILGRALQNDFELGYCFPVAQGKYNISASTNFRTAFSREKLDENANRTINVSGVVTTNAKATIEAKEDGYIYVCNSKDFYKNEKKLMISKMEANEYEEYREIQSAQPTCELNRIGDVKDELIVRADGTGQMIQRTELYDCSQITNKKIVANPDNTYYLFLVDKYSTNATRAISTHFTSKKFDKTWGNAFKVNGNIYFGRKGIPESITDEDTMKQWLIENKVKILFQLEEPIVTELSAEEVQKILNLKTYKPTTTIWNDKNADMEVTYVADSKNYIDNKFTELENSISSTASIAALEDCETE